jgi:hypothetical protein
MISFQNFLAFIDILSMNYVNLRKFLSPNLQKRISFKSEKMDVSHSLLVLQQKHPNFCHQNNLKTHQTI